MTFKKFIKNEIEGWKKLEVTWLLIACAVIVGLSIYWDDTGYGDHIVHHRRGLCSVHGKRKVVSVHIRSCEYCALRGYIV